MFDVEKLESHFKRILNFYNTSKKVEVSQKMMTKFEGYFAK